jgi:hypothetical protein
LGDHRGVDAVEERLDRPMGWLATYTRAPTILNREVAFWVSAAYLK